MPIAAATSLMGLRDGFMGGVPFLAIGGYKGIERGQAAAGLAKARPEAR